MYQEHKTLQTLLDRHVDVNSQRSAIQSVTDELSYRDLQQQVARLAAGLQSLGIKKGDVVAVQLPNIPQFIISYLAITSLGGIMQTLHMPYREAELRYLLEDSGARAVIGLSRFKTYSPAGILLGIAADTRDPFSVIALGEKVSNTVCFSTLLEQTCTNESEPVHPDDPFILLYTSGTTSLPKGIVHRYNTFLTNAGACVKEYGFSNEDKILSLAPLSHLYGLFACNMTLVLGAGSILLPAFDPAEFIALVKTHKPTAIFAGPAHFNACFQANLVRSEDFESVKFVCLSGSHVPSKLARQVDDILINGKVGQLWGMSELQAGAITRPGDPEQTRIFTTGAATPGTELRIVSDTGTVLAADEEGELQVRGASVFDHYLNKTEESKRAFSEDGWFKTGDTAILNEQGNLTITGRTKHIINRGGVKYNPIEIEQHIHNLPQVQQCAIIAIADDTLGEKACVFVVPSDGQVITLEIITQSLNAGGIAKYKWPEQLIILDSMPLTPTNKVKLEELKKYVDRI